MSDNENAPRPDLPTCAVTGEQTAGPVYILRTTDGETVHISHDALFPKSRTRKAAEPKQSATDAKKSDSGSGDGDSDQKAATGV